ncbi:hypothetical protein HD554DRAFT_2054711 [Boletus coccyginus]|nr:hypothetical protein HD554DRAFT_2054711 [Boletus coccyginus]
MNQNSTTTKTVQDGVQHSKPIPISTMHLRHRSTSFSSDSSDSSTSSPPLVTPNNFRDTRIPTSSSSPIFQFLSQPSPTKSSSTFPFRGFVPPPLFEDEPAEEITPPPRHTRRASPTGRFQPQLPVLEPHHERGAGVLRRLSLGSYLAKVCCSLCLHPSSSPDVSQPPAADIPQPGGPQSPPHSAPITNTMQPTRKLRVGRSATITESTYPRRAPSPMGERILKGHFDGFN